MRINKFLASNSSLSRRAADEAIINGRVLVNGEAVGLGYSVEPTDKVVLDNKLVEQKAQTRTVLFNKPPGYVCSRDGQGSMTVYDLIPTNYHDLNSVGRLDKYSSGLLLMSNDGDLSFKLTHPKFQKLKVYKIGLNKPLTQEHHAQITKAGVMLDDGLSKLILDRVSETDNSNWIVTMHEGRNRQIRRTFETLGYSLPKLHRTQFGPYKLENLKSGQIKIVD